MPLTFRLATTTDIPVLRDLASRIWWSCYPGIISPEQIEYMLGWMYSEKKIAGEITAGVRWEIVFREDAPIGYLALGFDGVGRAELCKLYLLSEWHGRGIGQEMLAHAIQIAAANACRELRLRVNKRNERALRSYIRAGFQVVESITSAIGGGFVMDDFVLSRNLD
jgi:ribosomal protein S18 acetylase RimI-like enzyme